MIDNDRLGKTKNSMNIIISIYKSLMPFIYIAAGVYLLAVTISPAREIHMMMAVVILLYGFYRLVRQYNLFGKHDERDPE